MSLSVKINTLVKTFRNRIPAESATAQAIDSHAPRRIIVACAWREGYAEFATELEALMQGRLLPRANPTEMRTEKSGADPVRVSPGPEPLSGVPAHNH
jgi:hypothetical protein